MYLKRLELQGFKSFREKTKLDFRQGVTAVVGPNGSGKSNISDAVRWVLGEPNAKALRGDKMEDVIFAGTKNRKPLGFAEVSLVMDNSDFKLNMDYDEVSITRRVYRSGESEYLINGAKCRLKDIYELFMDTGIGRDGYSIISQGRIDDILSTKSEDRRAVFEEAAGIVKFKKNKAETEKKLDDALSDLQLTQVTISELEKRLEPSKQQAEKTKKYLEISEKLKKIRTELFAYSYDASLNQIKECDKNIGITENNIIEEQKARQECEKQRDMLKSSLSENEQRAEQIIQEINSVIKEIQENKNSITLIRQKTEFSKTEIKRLEDDIKKGKNTVSVCRNEILINEGKLKANSIELETHKQKLDALNEKNKDISTAFEEMEETEKRFDDELSQKRQRLSDLRSTQQLLAQRLDDNIQNTQTLRQNSEVSKSRKDELTVHLKALEIAKNDCMLKHREAQKQSSAIAERLSLINQSTDSLQKQKNEAMIELTSISSRHKILSELENSFGGYNNAVRAILSSRDRLSGIFGSVAQLISTEREYETAIEVAVGGAMQNIITDSELSAKRAIEYLEREKKGRATFMPLSTIKPRKFYKPEALGEENVIGTADSLVYTDEKYKSVVSNILGGILVVKTIDDASRIGKKYGYAFRIVCLDGKVFNIGGSMTGGSLSKSVEIFSRNREIRDLEKSRDEHSKRLKYIDESLKKLSDERLELDEQTALCSQSLENISQNLTAIENDCQKTADSLKALSADEENQENMLERALSEQTEIKEKIKQNSSDIKAAENDIEIIGEQFSQYKNKIKSSRSKKEKQLNEMNELKIKINNINNERNNINSDIDKLKGQIADIEENEKALLISIEQKNSRNSGYDDEIISANEKISSLESEHNALIEKKNAIQAQKEEINRKSENLSVKIINHTSTQGKLEGEKQRLIDKKEGLAEKNKALAEDMWNKYEISYAQALSMPKSGKDSILLKTEKESLEKAVSALGSINPNAIEEYDEINKRYQFSIGQRDDIIKAAEDLRGIITELVEDMKERFCRQFEQINKSFGAVFNKMFGGDSFASIRLTDTDDVLSSGIEIIAEPDGKDTKKLSLLSGGERALTAIALLFGIINLKPSPFCILDEIEAALDDANVLRFANYLSEISEHNQFIVITHKTGTMEAADVLYGVTMEEQGISKIVSVDFQK